MTPTRLIEAAVLALAAMLVAGPLIARAARVLWDRPVWAVVVTTALVAVPWRSGPQAASATHVTPADAGGVLLLAIVALRLVVLGDHEPLRSWVVLPVALLAAAIVVSDAFAPGGASLSGLVRYEEVFCLLPLAAYLSIRGPADLVLLMRAFLVLAVGEGVVGMYQYVTHSGAGYAGQTVRAVGTFGSYDVIAMSKVVAVGLMIVLASTATRQARHVRVRAACAVVLVAALAMSLSRGSWLAAIVATETVLLVTNWRRAVKFTLAGLLALSVLVAVQGRHGVVVRRFDSLVGTTTTPDRSVQDRYALWGAAVGMWADHPLTGVGPKAFPTYRDSYVPVNFSGRSFDVSQGHYQVVQLLTPHSLYLLLFAELGGLGGLTYCWLVAAVALSIGLRSRTPRAPPAGPDGVVVRTFTMFAFGAVLVLMVTNIYGDIGGPSTVLDALWWGCALWAAAQPPCGDRRRHRRTAAHERATTSPSPRRSPAHVATAR